MSDPFENQALKVMYHRLETLGYPQFQEVLALQRWPDGQPLSRNDLEIGMQAMLVYEHQHVPLAQRTGFIHKHPSDC